MRDQANETDFGNARQDCFWLSECRIRDAFPFHRESDFFQLNLYPIAFRKVDSHLWVDKYKAATGLSTRDEYLEWCRRNRFPEIRSWMERGRPKLIVGVGSSFQDDFRTAFGFHGGENEENIEGRTLAWMSNGSTFLAVIPFLGQFQLDSDRRLQAFGHRLGALMKSEAPTLAFRTERGQPQTARRVVRVPGNLGAGVSASTGAEGWGLTFGSRPGSQAMRINRQLCDIPKTVAEISAGTARDPWGPDPVPQSRVREHLEWHWEANSGIHSERLGSRTLVRGLIRDAQGRYYLPVSMRPSAP